MAGNLMPITEARARILAAMTPAGIETVGLDAALGRVLAADVTAGLTQPPFAASAMDGYAVRAADLTEAPKRLRLAGTIAAGEAPPRPLRPGETMRIFTGAPVPDGADAVVMQEDTEAEGEEILFNLAAKPGKHVRPAGIDFRAGEVGLAAPRRLTTRDIGLAAAMDRPWLPVHRRARIAILATGDELVLPGAPRGPAQIVNSNSFALAAFVRAAGGEPLLLPIAKDDPAELDAAVAAGLRADLLLTIGGASVGDHDLVQRVLVARGMTLDFWRIAMRPGKPLMFGQLDGVPVLGLPGNPVSALLCALLFLRPALDRLHGLPGGDPVFARVPAAEDLPANGIRENYMRGRIDVGGRAAPLGLQDSAVLSALARADCLIRRPVDAPAVAAGETVEIIRLDPDPFAF